MWRADGSQQPDIPPPMLIMSSHQYQFVGLSSVVYRLPLRRGLLVNQKGDRVCHWPLSVSVAGDVLGVGFAECAIVAGQHLAGNHNVPLNARHKPEPLQIVDRLPALPKGFRAWPQEVDCSVGVPFVYPAMIVSVYHTLLSDFAACNCT